jgi:hypothetical protein
VKKLCSDCRFWQENPQNSEIGECRRRTPTVHLVTIQSLRTAGVEARPMAAFAPTSASSWCGEFEADDAPAGDA